MIIWRGWGILPVLIMGATLLLMIGIDKSIRLPAYVVAAAIVVAGVGNWFVGRALNRHKEAAGLKFWQRHTLFFVPMEWWSIAFVFLALIVMSNS